MGRHFWALIVFFVLGPTLAPAQGIITTFAGNGRIFRGDGGAATAVNLGEVQGVAVDSAGNVFASDGSNKIVVKISPSGVLTVVAGNGIAGHSGDGGSATNAAIRNPFGVAVDGAGNLYVVDAGGGRVRKISPDGVISTVAGGGTDVRADGIPATRASLIPTGVAADNAGNIFIADTYNHRIRKVNAAGIITTIAGTGVPGYGGDGGPATAALVNAPGGVAVDAAGNVYIADSLNSRVRRISTAGTISTVAGNGTATTTGDGGLAVNAAVNGPRHVAVNAAGEIFIVQNYPGPIRKINTAGIITTVAGGRFGFGGDGGVATSAALNEPNTVAVDTAGNFFIADTGNGRVRRVSATGTISTYAGIGPSNYSGDGGPATRASLAEPFGVAVDAEGNAYIADASNHRVRRVSAGGIITTFAGNGTQGFSGDNGPATSAQLNQPHGVAVDSMGNVYVADSSNGRIRRVSGGIITTVAGGGPNVSADNALATTAALEGPQGIAVGTDGTLYIADTFAHRIRKVSSAGIITFVAGDGFEGNGQGRFTGDGGPALNASLSSPHGVAVDAAGNVYIADSANRRIRRVGLDGVIRTVAGGGPDFFTAGVQATATGLSFPTGVVADPAGGFLLTDVGVKRVARVTAAGTFFPVAGTSEVGFSGDGGLATRATLNEPRGIALDTAGDLYIADTRNDRVRRVLAAAPAISVSPARLSFSAAAGSAAGASQAVAVSSAVAGLAWSVQASTQSGGAWLLVSPAAGNAPGGFHVSVNAVSLAAGTYRGAITVQSPGSSPPSQDVVVDLTVTAAEQPRLAVEPAALAFEVGTAGNPPPQALRISNTGGGTLAWTARAETTSGGNWLSVSAASGTAAPGSAATLQVAVNAAALPPGLHAGAIIVASTATGQSFRVTVKLLLSTAAPSILVSQTGLLFTGVEGGSAVPAQSFGVLNTGQGLLSWTAQASTLSGGAWLSVSPGSGGTDAAATQIPLVDVRVNLTGLRAGRYSGLVRVSSARAANSPQLVTVDLNVLPAGGNPGVIVRPTGLIFAARAGESSPGSQTVRVATAALGGASFVGGLLTFSGGEWLDALPRAATLSAAEPRGIAVQPSLGTLAPGVYRGAMTLLFADGALQTVNVLFLVVPPSASGISAMGEAQSALDCVPDRLHATQRSLGSNFNSPVNWPTTIEVQVSDNCGALLPNATVVASFSNGDPALPLVSLRNGNYVGSWRPVTPASQVTVTARANSAGLAGAEVQTQGQVVVNPAAPALFAGGVVNAANFAPNSALAPGTIVSVFGRNLAQGVSQSTSLPLATNLGGTTLRIGDQDVPLFFSSAGQINAQLPANLAPDSRQHMVLLTQPAGAAAQVIAGPETVTIGATQPAIFTTNQQGTGQGAILDTQFRLVDGTAPARAGEFVQVYCTGLGATNPSVPAGQAPPATEPLARVVAGVEARVGDRPATVQFAGLAPGFAGLYQVNVQIPQGVAPASAVPLVLIQNGVASNTVTLAVR